MSLPKLLADMNVSVDVVAWLRGRGADVSSILERGLAHLNDDEILDLARSEDRFVVTHDSDFGKMAFLEGKPFYGVIFLRPGDDPPAVVIAGLPALFEADIDWTPPLLVVFGGGRLRMRRPG